VALESGHPEVELLDGRSQLADRTGGDGPHQSPF
jgi:hypothetical protein